MRNWDSRINLKSTIALIVDSNEFSRSFTRGICTSLGFGKVLSAGDVSKALGLLQKESINVVICDWMLEPSGGEDFVRQVRTSEHLPNSEIPIIVLTGVGSMEAIIAARNVGINDFLVRPLQLNRLVTCLAAVIGSPRPFIRTPGYTGPDRRRKGSAGVYTGVERRKDAVKPQAVPESLKKAAEKVKEQGGFSVEEMVAAGEKVIVQEAIRYSSVRLQDLNDLFSLIRDLKTPGIMPQETLKKIYLKANDIRSVGQTFGFPLLTTVGGFLCEILEGLPPEAVRALFIMQAIETHATVMKMVVDANIYDETDALAAELLAGLRVLVVKSAAKKASGGPF